MSRSMNEHKKGRRFVGFCILVLATMAAKAEQSPVKQFIGIQEKLGQTVPMDVELYDESGNLQVLKDVINKPTIVTFVYFKCPGICSPLLNEMSKIVEKMDLELGKDYQILSLSFDHNEKPELAAEKKDNYLSSITRHIDPNGWRFFTGDSTNIHRFTDGAGFFFKRDSATWVHAGALVFLSPEGKVTRYINGINYLPFDVKMAVIESSKGNVTPTVANVLRFCFSYNPASHTYALNFLRLAMVGILVLVAVFVGVFIVRPKRKIMERQKSNGKST
jgi:protein SCO1